MFNNIVYLKNVDKTICNQKALLRKIIENHCNTPKIRKYIVFT